MNIIAPTISDRGSIDIVDAQFHLSHVLNADVVIPIMDALGIRSLLIDELWGRNELDQGVPNIQFDGGFRPISPLGLAAATLFPKRFSFLQRLHRSDPSLAAVVEVAATTTGCRAFRASMRNKVELRAFREGAYDSMLALAQKYRKPIFVLGRNAGELLEGVPARYPELKIVVDHCGWIDPKGDVQSQWKSVLKLSQSPNVYLKWCHANHVFRRPSDSGSVIHEAFAQAIEAFSPERIMWASDTTHEQSTDSWSELLEFVRSSAEVSAHDKGWVLGGTARRVLGWAPQRS